MVELITLRQGATSFGEDSVIFRNWESLLKWNPYMEHLERGNRETSSVNPQNFIHGISVFYLFIAFYFIFKFWSRK